MIRMSLMQVTALLLVFAAFSDVAQAEPPKPEVRVIPDLVEIPPQGEATALVVIENTGQDTLQTVQLSWFSDTGTALVAEGPVVGELAPYGMLTWKLRLKQIEGMPVEGTIHFRVDYTWKQDSEVQPIPRSTFGLLQVAARNPEAVERVAEVRTATTNESIIENRPILDYVVVANTSKMPIQVIEVLPHGPDFVQFKPPNIDHGMTLAPLEERAIAIQAMVTDVVQPGKYLLLYEVRLEWNAAGLTRTGNIIASHEVNVGVWGESEILTVLGIPSLLFLPGFLMIVTYKLLWGSRKSEEERGRFPLEIKTAEFWAVAILLSILTSFVYPVITGLYGIPRNYLKGYGLTDIASLWFISVISAVIAYTATRGASYLHRQYQAWVKKRRMPSASDDPVSVLQKLHRQNLGLVLERVDVKVQGNLQRAFLFVQRVQDYDEIWVGPSIIITWLETTDEDGQQRRADLQKKVLEHLKHEGSAMALARLVKKGHRNGILRVTWKRMENIDRPQEVKRQDIERYLQASLVIEQE